MRRFASCGAQSANDEFCFERCNGVVAPVCVCVCITHNIYHNNMHTQRRRQKPSAPAQFAPFVARGRYSRPVLLSTTPSLISEKTPLTNLNSLCFYVSKGDLNRRPPHLI